MIPPLDPHTSYLPLGRYGCTFDELKSRFVDDQSFAASTTRSDIYKDFWEAARMLEALVPNFIEAVWIGGSFVTGRLDPDDIDCTFVVNAPVFRTLSNAKKDKIRTFNKKNAIRSKTGLRVETFLLMREPLAMPWGRTGLNADAIEYVSVRGAWDDWWLRTRTNPDKDADPVVEDAEPKRGYLEVLWDGSTVVGP